jgi:hypothetical protein
MSEIQNLQTYGMIQKSCRLNFYCFINPFFFWSTDPFADTGEEEAGQPQGYIRILFYVGE